MPETMNEDDEWILDEEIEECSFHLQQQIPDLSPLPTSLPSRANKRNRSTCQTRSVW